MDELRAVFTTGSRSDLSAQEAFTNRVSEVEAFRGSVGAVLRSASDPADDAVINFSKARRNVMVYYGLGGIGKTALSKHLEQLLATDDAVEGLPKQRAAIRLDFGEAGEMDLETILLALRCGFGSIQPRWRAFDFVLAWYWARAHHGEPLPEFVGAHPRIGKRAATGIAEQLDDTARQVLRELGLAWAPARLAKTLITLTHERLVKSRTYRELSDSCPFFLPLVNAVPGPDMLSYMPSLLSWELDRTRREDRRLVVVFLDTFEPVTGRRTREFEGLIQRMIYLMPHVLFVITSRQRLDWADVKRTTGLDYAGGSRWPGLLASNQETEPRQHLVGALSAEDCETHLQRTLLRDDGTPAMSSEIRGRIAEASGGLPLYLDLALTQFLEIVAEGGTPRATDFGDPLPQVVASIMQHLDRESRDILRGVALLDAFDVDLAAVASGARDASVIRLLRTPVVVDTVGLPWPHTLHPLLRTAIRATDQELPDAWSPREWDAAAQRVSSRLGELCAGASARRERLVVASCFTQCVRLCAYFPVSAPWLIPAIELLADCGMWSALDVRMPLEEEITPSAAALMRGLRGLRMRRTGSLGDSIQQLEAAQQSSELSDSARDLFRLHHAHAVRNSGRYGDARAAYEQLARGASELATRAGVQLADLYMLGGDFPRALATLDALGDEGAMLDADVRGEMMRIRGHVHRANCDLELAELAYQRALTLARMIDSPALEGKALTNLAETLCWCDPSRGRTIAEQAVVFNRNIGNQLEVLKAHVAGAVSARREADDGYVRHLDAARNLESTCGYRAGQVFVLVALAACRLLRGEEEAAVESAREVGRLTGDLDAYGYWWQIVTWWCDARGLPDSEGTQAVASSADAVSWLAPPEVVRARWANVL